MPITRTPWVDDDGTGTTGTILNNAEKQALYNQIDAAIAPLEAAGQWITIPYLAGNFFGNAAAWNVEAADFGLGQYTVIGKTMTVMIGINASSVAGGNNKLNIRVPGGYTIGGSAYGTGYLLYSEGGAHVLGGLSLQGGTTVIACMRDLAGTAWTATTNATAINFTATFRIA